MTLTGKPQNKDTLDIQGSFEGQEYAKILISNKCFKENKTYKVKLTNISISGNSLIADAETCEEV